MHYYTRTHTYTQAFKLIFGFIDIWISLLFVLESRKYLLNYFLRNKYTNIGLYFQWIFAVLRYHITVLGF